jgi:serine/threonine-protein kinase
VLDFGIAKSTHDLLESQVGSATRTGTMVGTPHYMSPEQVEGAKSIDVRTDLWSLGVLAYRCLLGELPFTGDTIGSVALAICSRPLPIPSRRGTVPAGFDAWFARACARDPDARFDSARVAASELLELAAHQPAAGRGGSSSRPVDSVAPPTSTARAPSSLGFTTTQATSSDPSRPAARRKLRLWLALPLVLALGAGAVALTLLRSGDEPPTRTWESDLGV